MFIGKAKSKIEQNNGHRITKDTPPRSIKHEDYVDYKSPTT